MLKSTNQFLGAILQKEGQLIHCTYNGDVGKKALFSVVHDSQRNNESFRFVVEPEIIDENIATFHLDNEVFYGEMKEFLSEIEETRKLRPPGHIRLLVNYEFIVKGDEVDPLEFDVLKCISDQSKVDDIYRESDHFEYMVTKALVSLRKKGAIKVIR